MKIRDIVNLLYPRDIAVQRVGYDVVWDIERGHTGDVALMIDDEKQCIIIGSPAPETGHHPDRVLNRAWLAENEPPDAEATPATAAPADDASATG